MHCSISRGRKKSPKLRPSFPAYVPTPLHPNRKAAEKNKFRHRESNTSQIPIRSLFSSRSLSHSSFSQTHTFSSTWISRTCHLLLPPRDRSSVSISTTKDDSVLTKTSVKWKQAITAHFHLLILDVKVWCKLQTFLLQIKLSFCLFVIYKLFTYIRCLKTIIIFF